MDQSQFDPDEPSFLHFSGNFPAFISLFPLSFIHFISRGPLMILIDPTGQQLENESPSPRSVTHPVTTTVVSMRLNEAPRTDPRGVLGHYHSTTISHPYSILHKTGQSAKSAVIMDNLTAISFPNSILKFGLVTKSFPTWSRPDDRLHLGGFLVGHLHLIFFFFFLMFGSSL